MNTVDDDDDDRLDLFLINRQHVHSQSSTEDKQVECTVMIEGRRIVRSTVLRRIPRSALLQHQIKTSKIATTW